MKITGDPLRFCAAPSKETRAVLLYGPNNALIGEAALTLKAHLFPQGADDFAHVVINADELKNNATRLADELASFGFFAAKKLIHIKDAGDTTARMIQEALELPDAGHFLLIEAEGLGPKSALRIFAEKSGIAASVPCYEFDAPAMARFVQSQFQKQSAVIDSQATLLMVDRLGGDLSALPGIIAQLKDYIGGDKPSVKLEHVEAMLVDQAEHEVELAVQSVADIKAAEMDRIFHGLYESGTSLVGVLRAIQGYFYKLRSVQAEIKNGTSQDAALAQLRPPLFFKTKPHFIRHLRSWPLERIDRMLAECLYLESQCKKTGTPEMALVQQRLLRVMGV